MIGTRRARPSSRFLPWLLAALMLAGAASAASAEKEGTRWVPRSQMIDAIIGFAASHCGSIDGVLAALVEPYCKDPSAGFVVHMMARAALGSKNDEALRELCRRHGVADCQTEAETSRGQPILALDKTIAVRGSPRRSIWSPDKRYLLLDNAGGKSRGRLLEVASGQLLDAPLGKGPVQAAAWSPDGSYAAVVSFAGLRIVSAGSWDEAGAMPAPKDGCRFKSQRFLAFTADSRSLWVLCEANDFREATRLALKLSTPELKVEDELLLAPPPGVERAGFRAHGIAHRAEGPILVGQFVSRDEHGMPQGNLGLLALSLSAKRPIHPPLRVGEALVVRHTDDFSRVLLYTRRGAGPVDTRGDARKWWEIETWDTKSGERVATFGGISDADSTMTVPVAIPGSGLLIAAKGAQSSDRKTLLVLDERTGSVVQEIGPVPAVVGIVPSPDGARAAVFGHHTIRIYSVDHQG